MEGGVGNNREVRIVEGEETGGGRGEVGVLCTDKTLLGCTVLEKGEQERNREDG